ncbi:MAG: twin-arginine translocase subunit TatC [Clostridia bacterium]|nr:twin-arginine translocase subunit TatC [Clostridia bacterium]
MDEKNVPLTQHLEELRRVLIVSFLAILSGTVVSYVFLLDQIMAILVDPLERLGEELVFLGVTEGFFTQLKVSFFGGTILVSPIVIWQVLKFILPALYSHEKKVFLPVFFSGLILFATGIVFGYVCVLDLGLRVLLVTFSGGLTPMISVSKYVSFIISFLLPFGLVFEIPLVTYFLTRMGLITPKFLRKNRRYVIFFIFVLAAVLSPGPDIFTQLFLALPMIVLYEFSIIISIIIYRKKQKKLAEEAEE